MNDGNKDPKDELRNILEEGEEVGNDITDQGRERTEVG